MGTAFDGSRQYMPILWIIFHYRNQAFIFGDHGVREGALHRSDSSLNLLWRIAALALQRLANFLQDVGRPLGGIERGLVSKSEECILCRHRNQDTSIQDCYVRSNPQSPEMAVLS